MCSQKKKMEQETLQRMAQQTWTESVETAGASHTKSNPKYRKVNAKKKGKVTVNSSNVGSRERVDSDVDQELDVSPHSVSCSSSTDGSSKSAVDNINLEKEAGRRMFATSNHQLAVLLRFGEQKLLCFVTLLIGLISLRM